MKFYMYRLSVGTVYTITLFAPCRLLACVRTSTCLVFLVVSLSLPSPSYLVDSKPVQGAVTPLLSVGPSATGDKMRSRGQGLFRTPVKGLIPISRSVKWSRRLYTIQDRSTVNITFQTL